jgi:hypothetical protein
MGEPLGDLTFGTFYPLAPVSWQPFGLFDFNLVEELVTEVVIAIGLIVVFVLILRTGAASKSLLEFRGPWVIADDGGRPDVRARVGRSRSSRPIEFVRLQRGLGYAVLVEMIVATALYSVVWVGAAVTIARRRFAKRAASGSSGPSA